MDSVFECANKIANICKALKALSNDGDFDVYRKKLFGELQKLVLTIGVDTPEENGSQQFM